MKPNKVFKSLLAALLALLPQWAVAYDFMVDGLCYNINEDSTTVTVTCENSSSYGSFGNSDLEGDLIIPETVTYNGTSYSVTSIGEFAFNHCSGLTSVTIPNSVTSIGWCAFWNCSGLTSVTIPNSVTSIGNQAFCDCSGLTSVTIPNSVTSIGHYTFQGCSGLTSVTIPNSVTSIGGYAFRGCSSLTSVTIPNSVTSIGVGTFYGCSGLTSVTIPNSVTSIGEQAFTGCSAVTQMTCLSERPPLADDNTFLGMDYENCIVYVPAGSKTIYWTATGWKNFKNILEIDAVEPLKCDVNGDGKVDIADVNAVINAMLGKQ